MDLRSVLGLDGGAGGVEENTCSYEIYPEAGQNATSAGLEALHTQLLGHLMPFLQGYIWQRDRFALQPSTRRRAPWQQTRSSRRAAAGAAAAAPPPHLWGSLSFGDNIEDEWFAVWLLLELTRAFPVTARVWDNDGEFLLIEAAYGLPRWLKPKTAQNRVWLHCGAVHLVPLPRHAGDPLLAATPSLAQALAAVQGGEIDTGAPAKLRAALAPRLEGYPGRATEQMHVARALVPARVAHLLAREPQLVAAAVEAFHVRDPDDVAAAARMAAFPPADLVLTAPTWSRCLYAQVALQEYAPPRGYPLPLPSDPGFKAAELGLKLTAGFEMMWANRARFGQRQEEQGGEERGQGAAADAAAQQQQPGGAAALEGDPAWAAFRARLDACGYFRSSLPGSAQHSQLLAVAADSYRQTEAYRRSSAALTAPALRAEELLREAVDPAAFPSPDQLPPEGSEAWLQASAERRLEAELAARQAELEQHRARRQPPRGGATGGGAAASDGDAAEELDARHMADSLRAFVDAMSGLEGAELPAAAAGAGDGGGGVGLDEAAFAAELRRVLGLGKDAMRGAGGGSNSGGESSDEGSSFFSGGTSSHSGLSEDEEEVAAAATAPRPAAQRAAAAAAGAPEAAAAGQEGWEADTATDSDDEFLVAYGAAMDSQLAATRMAESFERAPPEAGGGGGGGSGDEPGVAQAEGGEAAGSAALRPVDVDLNLVNSLLASYGEQAGMPGPAGTLAGLLGLKLPDGGAPPAAGSK